MPSMLIVDDRPQNLLALQAILEPLGHELVTAGSGSDASGAVAKPTAATVTAARAARTVFRNMTILRKGYRTRRL